MADNQQASLIASLRTQIIQLSNKLALSESQLRQLSLRSQSLPSSASTEPSDEPASASASASASAPYPSTSAVNLDEISSLSTISPTAALISSSTLSYTDLFSQLSSTQQALHVSESARASLASTLKQVLEDIEERAPYLQAQRDEYSRLSFESVELARKLAEVNADKFSAMEQLQGVQGDLRQSQAQAAALEFSLQAAGKQLAVLLKKSHLDLHPELEGELMSESTPSPSDIISTHLTTYNSIPELVARNTQLLAITNELSAKLDAGDRALDAQVEAALRQAHDSVQASRSEVDAARAEVRAKDTQLAMMRDQLRQAEQHDLSVLSDVTRFDRLEDQQQQQKEEQDSQDTSKDFAQSFSLLNSDLSSASRQLSASQVKLARQNARMDHLARSLAVEQSVVAQLKADIAHITHAKTSLAENLGKQEDLNSSLSHRLDAASAKLQAAEAEARSAVANAAMQKRTCEQLRQHIDQLSAEKREITKVVSTVQGWLSDVKEQTAAQVMQLSTSLSERDLVVAELSDKLQGLTDSTEQNMQRKELEVTALRDKAEVLASELSLAKQNLSVAQEKCHNLQATIATLGKSVTSGNRQTAFDSAADNASLDDLKQQLQETVGEREHAKKASEQYKVIAQTSEAALGTLQTSYQEYQATMDAKLTEKNSEIEKLHTELNSTKERLAAVDTELARLTERLQEQKLEAESEIKILKDSIADLSAIDTDNLGSESQLKEQLRLQFEATDYASARYDQELLAHADSIKLASTLKEKVKILAEEKRRVQEELEQSQSALTSRSQDWETSQNTLSQEISDLNARIQGLNEQNGLLLTHLENSKESANGNAGSAESSITSDDSKINDVVRFLRKEKDSVELKLELAMQEKAQLIQQNERISSSYQECQKLLETSLSQQHGVSLQTELETKLADTSLQLAITKESNTTLRSELSRLSTHITDLEVKSQIVVTQIDPLKLEISSLQAEIASKSQIITSLEQDNEKWKTRNEQILNKYERTDPAELKQLKEKITALEAARDAREVEINAVIASNEDKRRRLVTHAGESQRRFTNVKQDMETKTAQLEESTKALEALREELKSAKELFESSKQSNSEGTTILEKELTELRSSLEKAGEAKLALQQQLDNVSAQERREGESTSDGALLQTIIELKSDLQTVQEEKKDLEKEKEALLALSSVDTATVQNLSGPDEQALATMRERISELESNLQAAKTQSVSIVDNSKVEQLELELSNIKSASTSSAKDMTDLLEKKSIEVKEMQTKLDAAIAERAEFEKSQAQLNDVQEGEEKLRKAEAEVHELVLKLKANEMKNKRLTSQMTTLRAQLNALKESASTAAITSPAKNDKPADGDKPPSLKISGAAKAIPTTVSFMNAAAMLASNNADSDAESAKGSDAPEPMILRKRPGEEIKRPEESVSGSIKQIRKPET